MQQITKLLISLSFILLPCLSITSCDNNGETDHRYLNVDQAIQYFHRNPYVLAKDVRFTEDGKSLSGKELAKKDIKSYGYDFGLKKNGTVNTIYLKEKRYQDNLLKVIISNYKKYPLWDDYSLPYNCDSLRPVLELIFDSDQGINNPRIDWSQGIDGVNDARTFSILTSCTFASLREYNRRELVGLFLSIQHSQKEILSFYYPLIVEAVEEGVFTKGNEALITDRLLLGYGYPQVYGTQLTKGADNVDDLMFPDQLDELREQMGLSPITEYVDRLKERYRSQQ